MATQGKHGPSGQLPTRPVVDVVAGQRELATLHAIKAARLTAARSCATYLLARSARLDYATALQIAVGVIEGVSRSLLQDRMGITARWSVEVAEAVLRIRALIASGDWQVYCRFHRIKEHARNCPTTQVAA